MILEFDDLRKIRWLAIYGASVAIQAEAQNLACRSDGLSRWAAIFERARDVADMDKEHGSVRTALKVG